jgi:hypothetical protein
VTSPHRPGPRPERPGHPKLAGLLLMIGIVVLIVILAATSHG